LPKRISAYPEPLVRFKCSFDENNVSSIDEATESKLQGSGMTFSKKSTSVLEVTDFEIIICPPTSKLKLKLKIDTNYINIYIEF
jgi:hypothetical protein